MIIGQFVNFCNSFLKFFYDSTNTLSGIYYLTTNLVLDILLQIAKTFAKYRYNNVLREIVLKMEEKYEKYWLDIPFLYGLSLVLDPRFKLHVVNCIITELG